MKKLILLVNYYKSGRRTNDPTIPNFAKSLSESDIDEVSAYVNSL